MWSLSYKKTHDQTNRRWTYTTLKEAMVYEHRLSEVWFWSWASWRLKKMLNMPTLIFHPGVAGDRLLGTYSLHNVWLGLFTTITCETSFQSCCKMYHLQTRIHSQFTHHDSQPNFLLAVRDFLNNGFAEQRMGQCGPKTVCWYFWFKSLTFITGDI
jgi:hypothetical protein